MTERHDESPAALAASVSRLGGAIPAAAVSGRRRRKPDDEPAPRPAERRDPPQRPLRSGAVPAADSNSPSPTKLAAAVRRF